MRISDWSSDVCSSDLSLRNIIGPNPMWSLPTLRVWHPIWVAADGPGTPALPPGRGDWPSRKSLAFGSSRMNCTSARACREIGIARRLHYLAGPELFAVYGRERGRRAGGVRVGHIDN